MAPKAVTGGQGHLDWSYWVWPLPPAGLMTFACEWAAYRITETSKQIEAEPIVRAARQSIRLWPARAS